jgi:hypothetical protein
MSDGQPNSWERTLAAEEEIARRLGNVPTLRQLIGHFTHAETDEDLEESTISVAISPEQRSYAALRVRGFSSIAASRQLNLNRLAAQRWETSDWFDTISEEERHKWLVGAGIDQKQEALIPLVPDTLQAIKDTLHSEDESIKLKAAQFVLDNMFGESKNPVGRPVTKRPDTEEVNPDLTEIMASAMLKINQAREQSDGTIVGIVSSPDYVNGRHNGANESS